MRLPTIRTFIFNKEHICVSLQLKVEQLTTSCFARWSAGFIKSTMHINSLIFTVLFGTMPMVVLPADEHFPDTTRIYSIDEVTVTEHYRNVEVRSSTPMHLLSENQLRRLNALQVSDAANHFSGVTIKDYGGIGGLKTISVRSLGANHTAVSYDGIIVNDNQSGQIDIGRFSLDNIEMLSLHNGQSDQLFQPARQFSSAAVLSIRSKNPFEKPGNNTHGQLSMKAGSFGLYNPSIFLSQKISQQLAGTLSAEWLSSHGRYPYKLYYHSSGTGEHTNEIRTNSDVRNLRLEGSLHGRFPEKASGWMRFYFYQAKRGLPGSTVLYASENFSTQRLNDRSFFARGHFTQHINQQWSWQWNGNYHSGNLHYIDTTYLNDLGRQESRYFQQEVYSSVAILYRAFPGLSFSFSSDGIAGRMDADFENETLTREFARPVRHTLLNVIAAKYVNESLMATTSILSTAVKETVKKGEAAPSRHRLSPYASATWKPFTEHEMRIRAFYKNIFRLPTFNDLYYARIGNARLKPETTHQWNAGITWASIPNETWTTVSFTADAFHNRVYNKIIALPTKNIFEWSMRNLGEVSVTGIDLTAETSILLRTDISLTASGGYSYQRALDITDPANGTYMHQIPYAPRISGSGRLQLNTPWADMAYNLLWSGKRYAGSENYAENRLDGYSDHSLSVAREISVGSNNTKLRFRAETLNIFNNNYTVVRWYPMPGRSYRLSATLHF
jgi:vitamin B12 transporter